MPHNLEELPLDVLFELFRMLSVAELTRVAQTCKLMQDCIRDRSVWLSRHRNMFTELAPSLTVSLSTDEIRAQVVREARIDTRWRQDLGELEPFVQVHPGPNFHIDRAELLPGGEFLLLISDVGTMSMVPLLENSNLEKFYHISYANLDRWEFGQLELSRFFLCPFSKNEGQVLAELCHPEAQETQQDISHYHLMIYSYYADASEARLSLTGALTIPFVEWPRYWASLGSTIGCLSEEWDENALQYYVTFYRLPSTSLEDKVDKRCFELLNDIPQGTIRTDNSIPAFVLLSSTRFLVAGPGCSLRLYDIPEDCPWSEDLEVPPIALSPTWQWQDSTILEFPAFQSSNFFFRNFAPANPMVLVGANDHIVHALEIPWVERPVQEHKQFKVDCGGDPGISFARGMWWPETGESSKAFGIALFEPMGTGSFELRVPEGMQNLPAQTSFDGSSGRVCYLLKKGDGRICAMVVDVATAKRNGTKMSMLEFDEPSLSLATIAISTPDGLPG